MDKIVKLVKYMGDIGIGQKNLMKLKLVNEMDEIGIVQENW